MKPRDVELRHAKSYRATCAVCGETNVPHRADGEPYTNHRIGKRHRAALEPVHRALKPITPAGKP